MKYINKKILVGFLISLLIIMLLGFGAFFYINKVIELSREGTHSQQILFLSERIRFQTADLESNHNRNISNGSQNPLVYSNLIHALTQNVTTLDSLTYYSTQQKNNVKLLRTALDSTMSQWQSVPKGTSSGDPVTPTLTRNTIGSLLNIIQDHENTLRKHRQQLVTKQFYQFIYTFAALLFAGLVLPLVLAFSLNASLKTRTESETKLSQAAEVIHDLYENAPCGYFSVDQQGMFIHVNRTMLQLLGYSEGEFIHKLHLSNVLSPEANLIYEHNFSALRETGEVHDIEATIFRKDGSSFLVLINATAVRDSSSHQFVRSRCTLVDITQLKKVEAESLRANKELEAFSYSVSHDLRAPLRSINGFSKILKDDYGGKLEPEALRLLDRVLSNATRMGQLIDDLLDFARLGKKEIHKADIDMDALVKNTGSELKTFEKERAIDIIVHPLGSAFADQSMIQQVWINLISNAIKYSRKKDRTQVEIGQTDLGNEVIFFVKDNGVGFDMKFTSKLFGVFQRLHKAEEFEGTGVGLALVKRIIERHGGRIWAEAKPNEGATFFFTLPKQ